MVRFSLFIFLAFSLVFGVNSYLIADDAKLTDDKEETTKDKDVRIFDLKPVFTEGMQWNEDVTLKNVRYYNYSGMTLNTEDKVSMKAKVKITEYKENKPTKIKFYEINGKGFVNVTKSSGKEFSSEYEVKDGLMECDIDKDLHLNIAKNENMESDIMMVYPGELFEWFVQPLRAVKLGDTWESEMIPVNKKQVETDEGKFEKPKGTFKLVEVKKLGDIEVAVISWTGTCILTKYMFSGPYDVSWKGEFKFDLQNKRVMSFECEAKVLLDEGKKGGMNLDISRKATYDIKKEVEEEKPVAPKNDEDE